uniref:Uncharacterized protein n=1 Tax=Panagrolaimus davidi TaxID=227884 RepID=A0A914QFV7_9BILA
MNNAIPQPPAAKTARVRNHTEAFGSYDETNAQHSPQILQFLMDLTAQQLYQLGQKDILIQNLLHKIEILEQENKKLPKYQNNENIVSNSNSHSNSNSSISKSKPANSTSNRKTYPKSVVVTNITESTETDEIKKVENDKEIIIILFYSKRIISLRSEDKIRGPVRQ